MTFVAVFVNYGGVAGKNIFTLTIVNLQNIDNISKSGISLQAICNAAKYFRRFPSVAMTDFLLR